MFPKAYQKAETFIIELIFSKIILILKIILFQRRRFFT